MHDQEVFFKNYQRLNEKQKEAVDKIDGPILVIAGPGSGKTQLLALRVANILKETDTTPQSILCLTFTDAGAKNMVDRLTSIIGRDAYKVNVHTFHSFATDIIGKYPESFFGGAQFKPLDDVARVEIMDTIMSSLDYKDPLSSRHPELGWTYKRDLENMIKDLKSAGIAPDEFESILRENKEFLENIQPYFKEIFSDKVTKKTILLLPDLIEKINNSDYNSTHFPRIKSYKKILLELVIQAYEAASNEDTTKPITLLKNKLTKIDKQKNICLKDLEKTDILLCGCQVYKKYQKRLYDLGLFDFSDMIVEINQALQTNDEFRYNLQEQFQYILVDEFQDTNGAQLTMIQNLLDMEFTEGNPNIMAVGDDDQAIYKFQGASSDNIEHFYDMFSNIELVQLDTNYRSAGRIVDFSHQIISQGESKLQGGLGISKQIKAFEHARHSNIHNLEFDTFEEEMVWVVEEISALLKKGVTPTEIVVLSRNHKPLVLLSEIATQLGVSVNYEKGNNVFAQRHIVQLITILQYIGSWIDDTSHFEKADLLATIFAFDFWELSDTELYNLSIESSNSYKSWMQILISEEGLKYSEKLRKTAKFLLSLGPTSINLSAEKLIDLLVGSVEKSIVDNEQDEYDDVLEKSTTNHTFISPFKEYYFPKLKLNTDKFVSQEYISMLSGLRALVTMVREYNPGKEVKVQDILQVVEIYTNNNLSIIDTSPFIVHSDAVNLMTAHKSKGLEFEYVFIITANEENWKPAANRNKLPFPLNMSISSEPDDEDDMLRLLYVAITRAKNHLFITRHTQVNAKKTKKIRYLAEFGDTDYDNYVHRETSQETHQKALELTQAQPNSRYNYKELKKLLQPQLDNYIMSVTHLNNFLDLEHAGPETFLENNLLRFPQSKDPSSGYGTAIHNALRDWYVERSRTGVAPTKEYLFERFRWGMKKERLNTNLKLIKQGMENLEYYFMNSEFETDIDCEVPFRYEGVQVGDALLAGNIDKIVYTQRFQGSRLGECIVVDYKTGKGGRDWAELEKDRPMKWFKYRQQLVFYKLLVEKSRRFGGKYIVNTGKIDFIESINYSSTPQHNVLEMIISDKEVEDLERLIQVVWKKIKNLDLPDISSYSSDINGTKQFIQDLFSES